MRRAGLTDLGGDPGDAPAFLNWVAKQAAPSIWAVIAIDDAPRLAATLKDRADLQTRSPNGETLLGRSVRLRRQRCVAAPLDAGASVDEASAFPIRRSSTDRKGPRPHLHVQVTKVDLSPATIAVAIGDAAALARLLEHGGKPGDVPDTTGGAVNAFTAACESGNYRVARVLAEHHLVPTSTAPSVDAPPESDEDVPAQAWLREHLPALAPQR